MSEPKTPLELMRERIDRCCNNLTIAKLTEDPIEREECIAIAAVLMRFIASSVIQEEGQK